MNVSYEDIPVDYHVADEHYFSDIFNVQFSRAADVEFSSSDTSNTFLRGIFAFISRIGFVLIQVGSIPVENVYIIIYHNLLEIAVAIASYGLIGFVFSFGKSSLAGWIGYFSNLTAPFADFDNAILGFAACLIGSAQISTYLVARISTLSSLIVTTTYCAFLQPMLLHWIINYNGWMNKDHFLGKRVSVNDHAGDMVIHLSSTIIGLTGSLFLGRRVVKVKDLDEFSFASEYATGTIVGYFLIILGYITFCLPTQLFESMRPINNYAGIITINNLIALATGIIVVSLLQILIYREILRYWILLRCIQGGIAGLVSIAAGIDLYSPLMSCCIASIAAILFFFFTILIHNTAIEDCCNLTASHLVCGFLGTLLCPLLAQKENMGIDAPVETGGIHFLWQSICLITVIATTAIFAFLMFLILNCCHILRNKYEIVNHKRAMILRDNLPKRSKLERLFMIDEKTEHILPGNFKENYMMSDFDEKEKELKASHKQVTFSGDFENSRLLNGMEKNNAMKDDSLDVSKIQDGKINQIYSVTIPPVKALVDSILSGSGDYIGS